VTVDATRRSQIAAWGALLAAVAAVVALIVLLATSFSALVLFFIALAVAGAAAWVALTRQGRVRLVAAAVALLALAAGFYTLVSHGVLDELIALAASVAIFNLLARAAMRESALARQRARRRTGASSRAVRRPRRFVLLMNPRSGDGKPEQFHLEEEARRRGIEPIVLQPGDDWRAMARAAARTADVIGMAGGDGSQALVAQIAMDAGTPYVCVPAGTRNHLALDLGLDRDDIVGALDAFASDLECRIDLAFVNHRIFVNNVSLGIYAEIVQSDAYRGAKLQTMEKMLPDLLGPRATPYDLRFRGPEGEEHRTAQLILVSNNPYRLDRLAGMGSRSRLDTGQLGIVAVNIRSAAEAAELISLETVGQVRRFPGWQEWTSGTFEVDSGSRVAIGIDGEAVTLTPPLRFRIAPSALRIRLPPTIAGLSPAAESPGLTSSGMRDLWRIASGRS
jgi:diacylglycerol kinase family enzyme